jgi:hypothetical protein
VQVVVVVVVAVVVVVGGGCDGVCAVWQCCVTLKGVFAFKTGCTNIVENDVKQNN